MEPIGYFLLSSLIIGIICIAWHTDNKQLRKNHDALLKSHNELVKKHNILLERVDRMRDAIGEMLGEIDKKMKKSA